MTDFSGALQDLGAVIAGPSVDSPAQPLPAQGPFAAVLGDIQNAKPAEPAPPPPPTGTPNYTGLILPVSTDEKGNASLDWNAGIPGMVGRAFNAASAPADVFEGRQPINDPKLTNRAMDFAAFFSPASVALRAGEVIPGEIAASATAPTAQQLKGAASAGYDAARASGVTVPGDAIAEMSRQVQQSLQGEHGVIAKTAPKTYAILDELANPEAGAFGTYPGLEAARRGLSTIASEGGTEGFAAQKAIGQLNGFIDRIAPEAADARANYAAAMRSNSLTGTLDKANTGFLDQAEARAHASHSGTNIDNSIRQRVASFLQKPENLAGFSPPEIDALRGVVSGGLIQNTARRAGNVFGGGGGLGQLAAGFAGAMAGGHLAGPEGGALGAVLPTAMGVSAKALENSLARRSLNSADEIVRQNSPLARALATEGYLAQPAIGRNSAVLRSLLPGLISSAPPQPSAPTPQSLARLLAPSA